MSVICKEFRTTSEYIYNWYSTQKNVKEESLTDWMLYDLSQRLPMFKYVPFTRDEENKTTGADFDLWVISKNLNFSIRVQAKKLLKKGNHFEALTYLKKTKSQIDLLRKSSKPPLRPMYLFYNNDLNKSKCSRVNAGTIITDANTIETSLLSAGKTKVQRQDILNISIPFECLFCCLLSQSASDYVTGIKSVFNRYFSAQSEIEDSGFSHQIPDYVREMLNPEFDEDAWLKKYEETLKDVVNCVSVLDLRSYPNEGKAIL